MNLRSTIVDLRPDHLATVNAVLLAEIPDYEVWAFGSRANWTAKDSSDLDLAIASNEPVPAKRLRRLQRAFEESYLPLKVDVVDLSKASPEFRRLIEKQRVVLRKPETDGAANHPTDREWRSLPLEDALETLIDYRGKTPKKVTQGIPLITARIIKGGRIETPEEFISPDDYEGWMRRGIPMAGDVLLTTEAPLGEVAQLDERKVALAQRVVALRGKKGLLDNDFLKYLLQSSQVQDQLKSRASGTTVQGIKQSELRKISLSIPPLDQQRAIAHTLGLLDKKIELIRRINATLEAMAQTLFKRWFVDLYEVPEGWEVRGLDEIADYLNGLALQKFPANGDVFLPVIKIAQLRTGSTQSADRASTDIRPEYIVEDGDVLFSWSGSLEVELWCGGQGALNQHLFKVSSKDYPKWFYYLWTREHLANFRGIAANKATTMGHIQRHHLSEAKALIPPKPVLDKMNRQIEPLIEKIIANGIQSRTLAGLRDALLPKLMSGQLRIPADS